MYNVIYEAGDVGERKIVFRRFGGDGWGDETKIRTCDATTNGMIYYDRDN
jgi:hypothetical protein